MRLKRWEGNNVAHTTRLAQVERSRENQSLWHRLTTGTLNQRPPLATISAYALLIGLGAVFIYPLLWMLASSVKSLEEIARSGLNLWPQQWHFDNYASVFESFPFWLYLKNTVVTTVLPIIGTTLASSLVAFGFARIQAPGRNILFLIVIGTMFLPGEVTIIPQFIFFRNLGMVN